MIFWAADVKVELLDIQIEQISLHMNGEHGKEDWIKLCEQAAIEQDPEKLVLLTREICRLLDERERKFKNAES